MTRSVLTLLATSLILGGPVVGAQDSTIPPVPKEDPAVFAELQTYYQRVKQTDSLDCPKVLAIDEKKLEEYKKAIVQKLKEKSQTEPPVDREADKLNDVPLEFDEITWTENSVNLLKCQCGAGKNCDGVRSVGSENTSSL